MGGKFKLRYMGQATKSWLYPTSKAWEVAKALTITYGNSSLHSFEPVTAYNRTVNDAICGTNVGESRKTRIMFRRSAGDLPQVSFYANLITSGIMYFETKQVLTCDCSSKPCNGTFRVSFDGAVSGRLRTSGNGSELITALKSLGTIKSSGLMDIFMRNVTLLESTPICRTGKVTNHTYYFAAEAGNFPRIGIWSSVVGYKNPSTYKSINATANILTIKTNDGRDDNIKLCNGIGKCDFRSGVCQCPDGYGPDPDFGPCAKLTPQTSKFNGIGRCPGVVSIEGSFFDGTKFLNKPTHNPRFYMSENPLLNTSKSEVVFYEWNTSPFYFSGIAAGATNRVFLFELTSSTSAGPLLLDQANDRLIFVDNNPQVDQSFIGTAVVNSSFNPSSPYSIWIRPKCKIFGLALNAKFHERIVYWTCPGHKSVRDGGVYFAYLDDQRYTTYNLLKKSNSVDPMGISFNYLDSRIYWLDKDSASISSLNVIYSCATDGSSLTRTYLPRIVGNHPLSGNLTDLVIDISGNNTALLIDASSTNPAVIGIPLNNQRLNDETNDNNERLFDEMTSRIISDSGNTFGSPGYFAIDKSTNIVMWSDSGIGKISFAQLKSRDVVPLSSTFLYDAYSQAAHNIDSGTADNVKEGLYSPVGILIDYGLGSAPQSGFLDCYGNGRCLGAAGTMILYIFSTPTFFEPTFNKILTAPLFLP